MIHILFLLFLELRYLEKGALHEKHYIKKAFDRKPPKI